jgi:hypothetical protein
MANGLQNNASARHDIESTFEPLVWDVKNGIVEPVSVQNKWVSGAAGLQKRKLENCELRLGDETRAFRPEIPERDEPETEIRRAIPRNFGTFP